MLKIFDYDEKKFTKTEQIIIKKIILDPYFVINATITKIAKAYYVSESTITRISKHLGFNNIKTLRMHIYERTQFLSKNYKINEIINLSDIVNNIRVYYAYSIHQTIDNLNLIILEKIINDCIIKNKIYIFGMGSSFLPCRILYNNLNIIGYNCYATENIHILTAMMINFTINDLLIIFSKSGMTKEIVTIISLANKLNIEIVLITNLQQINKNFKIKYLLNFELHKYENKQFPILSSKIVEILIADIIFQSLIKINSIHIRNININNYFIDD